MYKVKEFLRRIYNIVRWLPVLWKDQDWDHFYIWEVLKFKLKNQAKYVSGKGIHLSAKRDAEKMMLCVRLIEKIQNNYYETEYYEYRVLQEVFNLSEEYPDKLEWDVEELSNSYYEYFHKYRRIYKQVLEAEKTLFKVDSLFGIALNIAHINEERAHKLLFKILEENIKSWWD